jgi:thrombospondin type 3 repeat protein
MRGCSVKLIAAITALVTMASLLVAGAYDTQATTFSPAYIVSLSSAALSANASITLDRELDSPEARDSHHISFIPGAFGVANDAAIPDGAIVGQISLEDAESTSNGPCGNSSFLTYDLLDATTNTANTLADTPRIPSASWPGFADANANTLPDAVDKYPTFLKNLYPGLTPRARAYGSLPGAINRVVNLLTFEPGTNLPGSSPMPATLGYVVVLVRQDPTAPAATSTITDVCSVSRYVRQDHGLTSNNPNTAANEAGFVNRTNPATNGTYAFVDYGRSIRDFDDDGIENTLDGCPTVSTPSWTPRSADPLNDPDSDGLPGKDDPAPGEQLQAGTGCDPTPLTANSDHDGDAYVNRLDNCPLVANGVAQDNQADPDGDGIGNACDVVDGAGDGHLHEVCTIEQEAIGSGGTPATPACPEFVPDQDNDGFVRTTEQHIGTGETDPCGTNAWPADIVPGSVANRVDISDLGSFVVPVRRLGTSPSDPPPNNFNVRWDLVPGTGGVGTDHINIADMAAITVSYPAMLGGVRAFGATCPYAP